MEREEIKWLVIATLVLGFCFSFRDWGEPVFNFGIGLKNFILVSILVGFSVLVHEFAHKKVAKKYDADIKFKTWPALLFAALLITILTNGYFIFAAVWVVSISTKHMLRPRHKYPHLGPWEGAKIAASGPISNFFLALVAAYFFVRTGGFFWEKLMIINFWIAAMNLFPFFRIVPAFMLGSQRTIHNITYKLSKGIYGKTNIPYMEGEVIFFGSRVLGIFLLILTAITAILVMHYKLIFIGLLVGVISAVAVYMFMQYYVENWDYLVKQSAPSLPKFRKK